MTSKYYSVQKNYYLSCQRVICTQRLKRLIFFALKKTYDSFITAQPRAAQRPIYIDVQAPSELGLVTSFSQAIILSPSRCYTCKAPCQCPNIGCDGIRKSFSLSEIFSSDRLYPRAADEDCAVHKKGYRSRENPPTNIIFLFLFGKKKGERKTKESYRISQVSILLEIREVGLVFHVGGMEKNIFSDNDYIKASAVRNDVKAISYSPVSSTVLSLPPS